MYETSYLTDLAEKFGVQESALRLLVSVLLGYPVALAHRHFLYGKPPLIQHVYFISCGVLIGLFNFGNDMYHSAVNIVIAYTTLKTIGGTVHSVILSFAFNMIYLLLGYYYTSTDSYDIMWTMPHCVLVLRLIGLSFDLYDGSLPEEKLSKDSKKVALREVPSLLEVAAYCYFPTSFLVGPQFPMKKYQDFVGGKLKEPGRTIPDCVEPAIKRCVQGMIYLMIHTLFGCCYTEDYILSNEFSNNNIFRRLIDVGIWGHIVLYKYISIWLLAEGACILIGLAYNERDEKGNVKWDSCANVDLYLFETAQNFSHDYIASFNINTNLWVLHYVYKRLKFLGNKYLSQIGVLVFLAVWHGIHSGYYMCFFMEFISVTMEKDLEGILKKNVKFLEYLNQPIHAVFKWVALKSYTFIFMGPCVAPLALLSFKKWWRLYSSTYFFAQIFWGTWFLYRPLVKALLPPNGQA